MIPTCSLQSGLTLDSLLLDFIKVERKDSIDKKKQNSIINHNLTHMCAIFKGICVVLNI